MNWKKLLGKAGSEILETVLAGLKERLARRKP